MTDWRVPYVDLVAQHAPLKPALMEAVERVLDHGQFVGGPEVLEFERRFAEYCGTRHAIGVSSGTAALSLSLRGLGVGPGDEVITAPNSFLASASAIALVGATPVFADVRDDYNIDPDRVAAAITPRTRAIMPVHLTGKPADMEPLLRLADQHGLAIVEDCAQAVGARYREEPVGSLGRAGCFSLHPLKTLNAIGDGGVITTDDEALADWLRSARNHGLVSRDECAFFSANDRLDALQAALLLVKLDHVDRWNEARRARAAHYRERLSGREGLSLPVEREDERAVYHTFIVQSDRRDALQEHLRDRRIDTKVHYPIPIHLQPAARGLSAGRGSFPVTEAQAGRILSLPVHAELSEAQVDWVVDAVREVHG